MKIKLDLLFITMGQNPEGCNTRQKSHGTKGFKKLFKTFNKTNVGVDYLLLA
jgi:hypothetical protein